MTSTGARRRPQKYPGELRERAVRMVFEIREETGERHGAVTRVARELGVGVESLRQWVNRAEIDSGHRPGTSTADAQRIAQLEREVKELRRANEMAYTQRVYSPRSRWSAPILAPDKGLHARSRSPRTVPVASSNKPS